MAYGKEKDHRAHEIERVSFNPRAEPFEDRAARVTVALKIGRKRNGGSRRLIRCRGRLNSQQAAEQNQIWDEENKKTSWQVHGGFCF
jgi:hypothetical protein